MRTCLLTTLAATLLSLPALAQPASPTETFADQASAQPWSFSNGPEWPGATGRLDWSADSGRTDDGVLQLHYNFEKGGNYCAAIRDLPTSPPVQAVRMWLHKPADNLMIIRATDSKGEVFQKNFRYHFPGWQQVEITLADWIFSWGGDGTFDAPAQQLHILIERDGGNKQGILRIDDVQWIHDASASAAEQLMNTTTYTESAFTPEDRWTVDGPGTTDFAGQTLRYDFSEGNRCRLNWGRSVLGQPQQLKLTISSDSSGHEIRAIFGSHFQYFERSLGSLDRAGTQTLTVPMGDMQTWDHYGGEDDGIVRYPLRLMHIDLIKQTEQKTGQVSFKRLAFETRYERDFPVVLVPRVEAIGDVAAQFYVRLRSLHDEPLTGMLDYRLNGLDHTRKRGSEQLTIPAGGSTYFELPAEFGDLTMLEGVFEFAAERYRAKPASITIATAPPAEPPFQLDPDSRMGVGMYLYRFHNHPQAKEWMARMCRLAAAAGVKWTREEFHWNWVEQKQGEYDWSFFDQLVDTANDHGISVYGLVLLLDRMEQAARSTDEFIEHYCNYLRVLVGRYKDRIKHWEIWNEPNIFFWPGPRRSSTPNCSTPPTRPSRTSTPKPRSSAAPPPASTPSFIQLVLDLNAPFDALTVHPYRPRARPRRLHRRTPAHQRHGRRPPRLDHRNGLAQQHRRLTERQQANYVARTYLAALAAPACRSVSWYDFREDGTDPFYNEHHFGLIRNDLTPKIGYRALAAVGQLVGSAKFNRRIDLPGLLAFAYERPAGHVTAIWSPDDTRIVRLAVTADAPVEVHNALNEPAHSVQTDDTLTLRLEHNLPIYLLSKTAPKIRVLPAPIELTLDRSALHAGEQTRLTWKAQDNVTVHPPDAPRGWTVTADGPTAMRISPPETAAPGTYTLEIPVQINNHEMPLLQNIKIVPTLIRG
jgi:hypothetical protein